MSLRYGSAMGLRALQSKKFFVGAFRLPQPAAILECGYKRSAAPHVNEASRFPDIIRLIALLSGHEMSLRLFLTFIFQSYCTVFCH
jgi:hypothetical protein